jgi:hypothetical protein
VLTASIIIALMMEAGRASETLVNFYQTKRSYNPEDSNLYKLVICACLKIAGCCNFGMSY